MRSPSASATSAAGGVGVPDAEKSPPSRSASPATASRSSGTTTDARAGQLPPPRAPGTPRWRGARPPARSVRARTRRTRRRRGRPCRRAGAAPPLWRRRCGSPGAPQNSAPPRWATESEIVFSGNPKLVSSSGRRRNAAFSFAVAKATAVSACAPSAAAGSSSRAGCVATASPSRLETAVPSRPRGLGFFLLTKSLASAGGPSSTRRRARGVLFSGLVAEELVRVEQRDRAPVGGARLHRERGCPRGPGRETRGVREGKPEKRTGARRDERALFWRGCFFSRGRRAPRRLRFDPAHRQSRRRRVDGGAVSLSGHAERGSVRGLEEKDVFFVAVVPGLGRNAVRDASRPTPRRPSERGTRRAAGRRSRPAGTQVTLTSAPAEAGAAPDARAKTSLRP